MRDEDARCKMQDTRYKIQDTRYKMQDARCKMRIQDAGFKMPDLFAIAFLTAVVLTKAVAEADARTPNTHQQSLNTDHSSPVTDH